MPSRMPVLSLDLILATSILLAPHSFFLFHYRTLFPTRLSTTIGYID